MTELPETIPRGAPTPDVERAANAILQNKNGFRDRARRWWQANRVDGVSFAKIVRREKEAGRASNIASVSLYVRGYDLAIFPAETDVEVAYQRHALEVILDETEAKLRELDNPASEVLKNTDGSPVVYKGRPVAIGLPEHSRYQTWAALNSQRAEIRKTLMRLAPNIKRPNVAEKTVARLSKNAYEQVMSGLAGGSVRLKRRMVEESLELIPEEKIVDVKPDGQPGGAGSPEAPQT